MPLKGIPAIISPDLLRVLARMGHGDEIVLADAHFPTSSICSRGPQEIRADGHNIPDLLEAVLKLFPLDTYVDTPVVLMSRVEKDMNTDVPVWETYSKIVSKAEGTHIPVGFEERFQFYERANRAFAVVHTGELAKYGNIILKKGIVTS